MSFQNKPGSRQNFFARRYDWQTLLYREGGAMRNNAAHTRSRVFNEVERQNPLPVKFSKPE